MNKRVTLKIYGMVQGVGYRYIIKKEAKNRGFVGYVSNLDDGTVKIVVQGEEGDLKDFIRWCYNGVGSAMVQKIDQDWSEVTSLFSDFEIN